VRKRRAATSGARVARNVRLGDMNLDAPVGDERCIEVVANGLWHGFQLALDATIVSPVTRRGEAQPRSDVQPGHSLDAAARRKRRDSYPEFGGACRCRLCGSRRRSKREAEGGSVVSRRNARKNKTNRETETSSFE